MGYTSWSPLLYRFWNPILFVFITFCCFFGMSFTCLAFRVNFANVRFTSVKRRFLRSSDVTKYISFVTFQLVSAVYFCMHFPMDLGTILARIWGRIWGDFSRNAGFLRVLIFNQFLH